jgi:AcrR family transcriptional regulator
MTTDSALDTRDRLLRAAVEVFAESGYESATVREICRRADANVAAVNYYFGDKRSLYTAIFDMVFETLHAVRPPFLPRSAPPEQRLETCIRSFFEELFYCEEADPDCTRLSAMYLMEMARPTEVLDRVVRDYIASDMAELHDIVAGLLGGDPDSTIVSVCAASIAGQILYYYQALPLIERLHPQLPPPSERIDSLVAHVLAFSRGGIAAAGRAVKQGRTGT